MAGSVADRFRFRALTAATVAGVGRRGRFTRFVSPFLDEMGDPDAADHHYHCADNLDRISQNAEGFSEVIDAEITNLFEKILHGLRPPLLRCQGADHTGFLVTRDIADELICSSRRVDIDGLRSPRLNVNRYSKFSDR